jgi:hypothetical protein
MADALRHLTRLGVYKVAMPVSRKFLEFFCSNKPFTMNRLKEIISVGCDGPEKQPLLRVVNYVYTLK